MDESIASIRMQYAAVAGLCTLFLLLPDTLSDLLVHYSLLSNHSPLVASISVLLYLLLQVTSAAYTYGFALLANRYSISFLRIAAFIEIIVRFIYFVIPLAVLFLFLPPRVGYAVSTPLTVVQCLTELFTGAIVLGLPSVINSHGLLSR